MNISDSTILRIKVPAHLYESVKEQLLIKEGKGDNGMPGSTVIKEKKTGDKPASKKSAPKKPAGEKKASTPKDGHKKVETEKEEDLKEKEMTKEANHGPNTMKLSVEDMKRMKEILEKRISEMEGVKEPIKEEDYDFRRDLIAALGPNPSFSDVADYLYGKRDGLTDAEKQDVEMAMMKLRGSSYDSGRGGR